MKKFKFNISSSSNEDLHDSDASDDEIPDLNVSSRIKITEPPTINFEQLRNKHSESYLSDKNQQNTEKSKEKEKESVKGKNTYKSYLAQRTKELLKAFSSDNEEETSKIAKNINNDNQDTSKSTTTSSSDENNDNLDSAASESNEKEISDYDPNVQSNKEIEKPNENSKLFRPVVKMRLTAPDIPIGRRQQKLINSIKKIYDFFDHKISYESIIYAIHDHAGNLKEAISTLNKYPNKYNNFSLHNMPSNADQAVINNYLRIFS
ncbi:hypothetical protein M9Y10_012118 [Tritrichomonas musculus]|uniref:Uncharacterized protein n=1 Tax=Tritrichomonas musculus TaxID=1915356 RepID=A0ABR2IBQ7_9EUKA